MIERINMTTKSDAQWRYDLAMSFRRVAAATDNQSIREWYEREAAGLERN